MNRLYQIVVGSKRLPLRNCLLRGGSEETVDFTYSFWLVDGPDGLLLIDTGFGPEVAKRRGVQFGRTCAEALHLMDVSRSDIRHIVLTHSHFDHAGSLSAFPNARVYLQQADLDFYTGPLMRFALCASAVEADDIAALSAIRADGRLTLLAGDAEIRPGVRVHHVGGHTPGMQVVSVTGDSRRVVLASDAAHLYANLSLGVPFPVLHDVPSSCVAFEVLESLGDATTDVVPGHDGEVMSRFEPVAGPCAPFAVRLL